MEKNQILDIQPAVKAALEAGSAVVALESKQCQPLSPSWTAR